MITVVKIGGNVVDNPELLQSFLADFSAMEGPRLLVHGGGVMASRVMEGMGLEPVMIEGRRVTDRDALRVVTMVYSGWCNKDITARLQGLGCNAIGLSGCDANVISAKKRAPKNVNGTLVDYGYVGDVHADGVNAPFLLSLLGAGICPVLCAINHDGKGNLLNTNADTIAQSVALALAASSEQVKLVYCFEKDGVLLDLNDSDSLVREMDEPLFCRLKAEGKVAGGMIPKLENAFKAISEGVASVRICHARNLGNDIGTTLVK